MLAQTCLFPLLGNLCFWTFLKDIVLVKCALRVIHVQLVVLGLDLCLFESFTLYGTFYGFAVWAVFQLICV